MFAVICGVSAYSLFWVSDIGVPATLIEFNRDSYSTRTQDKQKLALTMHLEPKF